MKHLDKAWLYFSTSHSQFKYFPAVWTSSLSCRVVFTWWIVLPINCGIFQSLRSAKWLSDASSASAQLPGFYWLSVPVICGFCSLALILTNETLNDSSFKTCVWGQQLLRFLLEAPSTLIFSKCLKSGFKGSEESHGECSCWDAGDTKRALQGLHPSTRTSVEPKERPTVLLSFPRHHNQVSAHPVCVLWETSIKIKDLDF